MTARQAIERLYRDGECWDYCLRVCGSKYMADDLMSYSFEQLLLKDEAFIIEKHNTNMLKRYFGGIVYRSYNYPNSPFYKEYIKPSLVEEISKDIDVSDDDSFFEVLLNSLTEEQVREEIELYECQSEDSWYEASIFKLYMEYGNLRALNQRIKIPVTSLAFTVNQVKKKLSKIICQKYYS